MGAFDESVFTDQKLAELDGFILTGKRLLAITVIAGATGVSTREAFDVFGERFEQLVALRPDDFTVDTEKYWDHFSI